MGPNGIRGIFVTIIISSVYGQLGPALGPPPVGQNAMIITDPFGGETAEQRTIFEDNAMEVAVRCNPTHMCVSIDETYFISKRSHPMNMASITMQEPCEGNRTLTGTELTLCTGIFGSLGCGLTFDLNQTHVSYVTTLETGNATRTFDNGNMTIFKYNIPFQCTFPLEEILTLESETGDKYGHYIPQILGPSPYVFITILTPNGEGVGKFPIAMFLYKDSTWTDIHLEPPVKNVSDTLYVRLVLVKSPERSVIQARRCWATPTEDANGAVQFTLIDDYCAAPVGNPEQDPQVNIQKNGISTYAEWTSKVFQFKADDFKDRVYLHCIARICFQDDPNSPSCNKIPCPNGRKKRAAIGGTADVEPSSEVQLTLGPIIITKEVMEIAAQKGWTGDGFRGDPYEPEVSQGSIPLPPIVAAAIICGLAIIILILLGIVVVIAKRKISESK